MEGNRKGVYGISHEENYTNGQIIFKEDSPGEWLYIVLTGSVETSRSVEGRKITIERLQPGDLFGEMEFIGRMKRTVTAQAVGATTLGIVDRDSIVKEYNQLSKQFKSILETIPARLKKMIDRACDASS
ncbi:MAG: cyclic nucleotide-binding domain-containing protein [Deltaproteobacteria bacterium]|nr:cyclic nucleotide-binding domain-containing protein [Deltaproteobacteria bacterium]